MKEQRDFRRVAPVLVASALALPLTALAQSNNEMIEEITIWGTEVRASSIRLEADTLAIKQADHVSDLLRTIPGVDVGGAHSLNQRITIRSMDDKDLRISIDGANQNTYMYHHMGNLQIHADILQSVDVEIGTNSVVNGGLGGEVRFETKQANQLLRDGEQFGFRLQGMGSDNYGSSYALTGYGEIGDELDVLLYYNDISRDNYEVGGGEIKDANGVLIPGTDGEVRGLEGDLEDLLIKFGWDITADQRLEFGYETYNDQGDYSFRPDMGLATDLAITNSLGVPLLWPTEFSRDTYTLNYDAQWGGNSSVRAALFRNDSELQRDERGWAASPPFAASAGFVFGEARNTGLNVLAESLLDIHTLTYGVEIINYDTDYRAVYTASTDTGSEEATSSAIFLQDRIQISDRFALIPGARYTRYDIDSAVVDNEFSDFTVALAGELQMTDNFLAKLSTTQLFKGPEIGEVFIGAGLFDIANQGITEETGTNTELAFAFEDAVLGADRFAAGVTFFNTELDDYIYDYATPPPSVGGRSWKDNIGDMSIDGYEAYVGYDVGELSAMFTYSVAESDLDAFAEYAALQGARLDRQQGDTISFNLDYAVPSINLLLHWDVLDVDGVSSGLDLDGATLNNAKDGFTVHNVSALWSPEMLNGVSMTLGVDNLFDEYYASQSSRTGVSFHPRFGQLYLQDYEPGRNVKLTVSAEF